MNVFHVFTPNDTPTATYVDRKEHKLEESLKDYYRATNVIVSLSGPSKTGKTVLIKKVVPDDELITVPGSAITSAENLWERVLRWMDAPSEVLKIETNSLHASLEGGGSGGFSLPGIGELKAQGTAGTGGAHSRSVSSKTVRSPLEAVISEIAKSEFVVFIDDFHYIAPDIREDVGRQIKAAAESGVKIFTASVPYRSDDVVRSNPELRGRVASLNLGYWGAGELREIASKGFHALNIDIDQGVVERLIGECFGSPQLMQSLCLNLCLEIGVREAEEYLRKTFVSEEAFANTLRRTAAFTDFSKLSQALHTGPKTRGTERRLHIFKDGSKGDVYRAVLLAIKENPAALSFGYDEIINRVRAVCEGEAPVGSSVSSALMQMHEIAEEMQSGASPLSWYEDTLDIADPYLLFYLRCSDKLQALAK